MDAGGGNDKVAISGCIFFDNVCIRISECLEVCLQCFSTLNLNF